MKSISAVVLGLACAVPGYAEEIPVYIADDVVVTATRSAQPVPQSIAHVSVITQEEIRNSQAVDVPSLLRGLAGVEVYQSGGVGKLSSTFMRGTNSSHVLVLLDGVRINSATAGTTALDQLMLDQIERIEVVRGNVSSLYGSEAIGGVIQIFTKQGRGAAGFNVSAGAGSLNTQRLSAGFGGEVEGTRFNLQASTFKTDGVSAIKPAIVPTVNPDRDGYDNTTLSAGVRHAFNTDHSLAATVFHSRGNNQYDNAFGMATDVNVGKSEIQKLSLASENRFSASWQSKLQLAEGKDNGHDFLNGIENSRFETANQQLAWQNTLQLSEGKQLLAGLERLEQRVSSNTAFTRTKRTVDSLFAGYTGNYGVHQVQANLRQDRYSDFGTADTGLLGYGYVINDAWRATASYATAFKAPTLNDLFYPFTDYGFGFTYQGNPNLKPERSRNMEVGAHYASAGQRVDLVYFDNRVRDLIANNGQMASTMINLGEARSDGVEIGYVGGFGNTTVQAALTAQDPRDTQTGQVLVRRAKTYANLRIGHVLGAWQAQAEWQHSGTRVDYDINTFSRTNLASYDVINLAARYAFDKRMTMSIRVDNLFDRDYMLAHGYNTPGRTLFMGISYQQ